MSVPEVCSHEIVCVEDSVAPVAAGEEEEVARTYPVTPSVSHRSSEP